jgi:Flp pilus assembly pilin Flp
LRHAISHHPQGNCETGKQHNALWCGNHCDHSMQQYVERVHEVIGGCTLTNSLRLGDCRQPRPTSIDKLLLMSGKYGSLRVSASHLAHGYTGFHNQAVTHPNLLASLYRSDTYFCTRSVRGGGMLTGFQRLWAEDNAQDIAEYAVMLAVILVIVVATVRLIGGNANNVFSAVASSIAQ